MSRPPSRAASSPGGSGPGRPPPAKSAPDSEAGMGKIPTSKKLFETFKQSWIAPASIVAAKTAAKLPISSNILLEPKPEPQNEANDLLADVEQLNQKPKAEQEDPLSSSNGASYDPLSHTSNMRILLDRTLSNAGAKSVNAAIQLPRQFESSSLGVGVASLSLANATIGSGHGQEEAEEVLREVFGRLDSIAPSSSASASSTPASAFSASSVLFESNGSSPASVVTSSSSLLSSHKSTTLPPRRQAAILSVLLRHVDVSLDMLKLRLFDLMKVFVPKEEQTEIENRARAAVALHFEKEGTIEPVDVALQELDSMFRFWLEEFSLRLQSSAGLPASQLLQQTLSPSSSMVPLMDILPSVFLSAAQEHAQFRQTLMTRDTEMAKMNEEVAQLKQIIERRDQQMVATRQLFYKEIVALKEELYRRKKNGLYDVDMKEYLDLNQLGNGDIDLDDKQGGEEDGGKSISNVEYHAALKKAEAVELEKRTLQENLRQSKRAVDDLGSQLAETKEMLEYERARRKEENEASEAELAATIQEMEDKMANEQLEVQEQLEEMTLQNNGLKRDLQDSRLKEQIVGQALNEATMLQSKAERDLFEARSALAHMESQSQQQAMDLEQMNAQVEMLQKESAKYKQDFENMEALKKDFEKEMRRLLVRTQEFDAMNEQRKKEMEEQKNEMDRLKEEAAQRNAELERTKSMSDLVGAKMKATIEEMKLQIKQRDHMVSERNAEIEILRMQLQQAVTREKERERSFSEAKAAHAADMLKFTQQLESVSIELSTAKQELESEREKVASLEEDLEHEKQEREREKEQQRNRESAAIALLQQQLDHQTRLYEETQSQASKSGDVIQGLRAEVSSLRESEEALRAEVEALRAQKSQWQSADKQVQDVVESFGAVQEVIEELQSMDDLDGRKRQVLARSSMRKSHSSLGMNIPPPIVSKKWTWLEKLDVFDRLERRALILAEKVRKYREEMERLRSDELEKILATSNHLGSPLPSKGSSGSLLRTPSLSKVDMELIPSNSIRAKSPGRPSTAPAYSSSSSSSTALLDRHNSNHSAVVQQQQQSNSDLSDLGITSVGSFISIADSNNSNSNNSNSNSNSAGSSASAAGVLLEPDPAPVSEEHISHSRAHIRGFHSPHSVPVPGPSSLLSALPPVLSSSAAFKDEYNGGSPARILSDLDASRRRLSSAGGALGRPRVLFSSSAEGSPATSSSSSAAAAAASAQVHAHYVVQPRNVQKELADAGPSANGIKRSSSPTSIAHPQLMNAPESSPSSEHFSHYSEQPLHQQQTQQQQAQQQVKPRASTAGQRPVVGSRLGKKDASKEAIGDKEPTIYQLGASFARYHHEEIGEWQIPASGIHSALASSGTFHQYVNAANDKPSSSSSSVAASAAASAVVLPASAGVSSNATASNLMAHAQSANQFRSATGSRRGVRTPIAGRRAVTGPPAPSSAPSNFNAVVTPTPVNHTPLMENMGDF